jgi:hypothetical protein
MENLNFDPQLKNTWSTSPSSLDQISHGAIVMKEIYYKMILGEIHKKILTGFKFHHLKSDLVFDVITKITLMNLLPDLDEKMVPIIHSFNYPEIRNPQLHLLSLNQQFPKIIKAFVCFYGNLPRCKRLITNSFGSKMFVPASYILLDENDYSLLWLSKT